jgi:hypothetical protein
VTFTFTVEYPEDTEQNPTTGDKGDHGSGSDLGADSVDAGAPVSPAASIPSHGSMGESNTPPHTPLLNNQPRFTTSGA